MHAVVCESWNSAFVYELLQTSYSSFYLFQPPNPTAHPRPKPILRTYNICVISLPPTELLNNEKKTQNKIYIYDNIFKINQKFQKEVFEYEVVESLIVFSDEDEIRGYHFRTKH